jgi:quinol monooxygenase YgiN
MPGCFSYVVAKDSTEENILWVTEVWDSVTSHDASLLLPCVKNAMPQESDPFESRQDRCYNSSLEQRTPTELPTNRETPGI